MQLSRVLRMIFSAVFGLAAILIAAHVISPDVGGWVIFFVLYGIVMAVGGFGTERLVDMRMGYEVRIGRKEVYRVPMSRLALYSIMSSCPFYLFTFAFSLIPILSYQVWCITMLPCLVVVAFPMSELAEMWKDVRCSRCFFWLMQAGIFALTMIGGSVVGKVFFT